MALDARVRDIVDHYLAAVDAAAPGLAEGFYLTGSVALEDFHPGASDIDFVAVTRDMLSTADLTTLKHMHSRRLAHHTWWGRLDGLYVTWRDLTRDPALADPAPHVHEGRFHRRGAGDPITWRILADHGVVVRGSRREDLGVWVDRGRLDAWLCQNLDTYGRPWLRRSAACSRSEERRA